MTEADAAELSESDRGQTGDSGRSEARTAAPGVSASITCQHGAPPPLGRFGALPPALASRFTTAENAVLAVIAAEHVKHGRCTLPIDHIAALAGVGRTTVKNALREAQGQGLSGLRNGGSRRGGTRRTSSRSPRRSGLSWLRMRRRGVGSNSHPPRIPEFNKGTSAQRNRTWAAEGQGSERDAPRREASRAENLSYCNSTKRMKPRAARLERR